MVYYPIKPGHYHMPGRQREGRGVSESPSEWEAGRREGLAQALGALLVLRDDVRARSWTFAHDATTALDAALAAVEKLLDRGS